MNARILVLSAGFGEGHNAAARALVTALVAEAGTDAARFVDAFALAGPRRNALARRVYVGLVNRAPGLWRRAYGWLHASRHAPALLHGLGREARALHAALAEARPTLVCSTYPVYGFLLERLRREGRPVPAHCQVVTDSISINSLWWRARCDAWFLPNADSAAVLRAAGLPERDLHVLGFPVDPRFGRPPAAPLPPPTGPVRPRVLCIVNSRTATAAETARQLVGCPEWDVTCAVGRNTALGDDLRARAARRPAGAGAARILGWSDEIPALLQSHHVVISKAGGATTQEALAAGCPMIVNQIFPGQEEGNWELLRRHGCGGHAEAPGAVLALLRETFAGDAVRWRRWRAAAERLARPHAARDIARALLARVHAAEEPIPVPHRAGRDVGHAGPVPVPRR
jgi:processive 1,2-diacylglycerol beta-glucosyltransferase